VRVSELAELSALISTEPLDELVRSTLRFHDLKKSPASLKLATTDWKNGRLRVFCHESGHTRARHRKQDADISEQNFMKAVLASTAIPGIFPTVPVLVKPEEGEGEPEERRFADGGLVMNTPLNPAIEAGATKIHLLCLNPDMNQIAQNTLENTLDTLTRALVATVAGSIHTDLEQVQLVNRIAGIVRRKSSDQFYDAVEVHRYHPTPGNLGGLAGILDFSSKHVEALIADGRAVAATHDCAAAHCVIPERR
jgi:predicted acylesterase/phospholipase RssA